MQLHSPFIITPRLMAGLKIGNAFVSIGFSGETRDGRAVCQYHIDTPDFEYSANDLKSGVGGGSIQDGMESLLSFLCACAESRRYARSRKQSHMDGENSDLFPENVGQWAEQNSEEISMLEYELSENKELITD